MESDLPPKTPQENKTTDNGTPSFNQLSILGLDYLQRQRHYIILSLLYPLFTIILQIFNSIFIINISNHPPDQTAPNFGSYEVHFVPFFDIFTPGIIFSLLALVALVKIAFLFKMRKKVIYYETQQKNQKLVNNSAKDSEAQSPPEQPEIALTDLFYDLADHMGTIQKLSIVFYVGCIIFLEWYARFFLFLFVPLPTPEFNNVLYYVNLIDLIALILFLIPDVRQFRHWNKKLKRLHQYEQKIFHEFEGNTEMTRVDKEK